MTLISKVYDSLKWKMSDKVCAKQLNIPLEEYKIEKARILEAKAVIGKDLHQANKKVVLDQLEGKLEKLSKLIYTNIAKTEKLTEFKEDLENGTASIKGQASEEPQSPEDIIRILKIDTRIWKLSSYWNKQQNGYWLVSALVSRVKEQEATQEDITGLISEIFNNNNIIPFTPYSGPSNKKALFVYLADKHIGSYVSSRAMFSNKYCYEQRVNLVIEEIKYLVADQGRFEDIFLFDLGDRMDGQNGFTTRGGHKLPQNQSNREAYDTVMRVDKDLADQIFGSDMANHYHFYQNANSNHGGDFDYFVSSALEMYVNLKYDTVNTRIMEKLIDHTEYGLHTILMTHGKDDEDMKHGLPLHLNDKTEGFLNKYLMKHSINPVEREVHVIKADLHQNASQDSWAFRYRNAMSLYGGSKWIGNNFGPTSPGCSFDIYEKDTPRVFEHRMKISA